MPMNQDAEHLRLLSIFHYILGVLLGLFACLPFIHFFIGLAIVLGAFEEQGEPTPPEIGYIFMAVGGLLIVLGWSIAICVLLAGRWLRREKNRTFCLVVAGIECLFIPVGTILGVLTIMALLRPSIQARFEGTSTQPTVVP